MPLVSFAGRMWRGVVFWEARPSIASLLFALTVAGFTFMLWPGLHLGRL